jgi:hypothetical protein
MTVVVTFLCTDGMVVAADSMLTPSMGNMPTGHHKGRKVHVLPCEQVFSFAGDLGQAARVRALAEVNAPQQFPSPLQYGLAMSQTVFAQFTATGIANTMNVNAVLGFVHSGLVHCCLFQGAMQPFMMDKDHFYAALGSGKLSGDPFLRFLVDTFCHGNTQPNVREAIFLATWAVQHVIETNPGGVAGPIRLAVIEQALGGPNFVARELPDNEIGEHVDAARAAAQALRDWRDAIQGGRVEAPPLPIPPKTT